MRCVFVNRKVLTSGQDRYIDFLTSDYIKDAFTIGLISITVANVWQRQHAFLVIDNFTSYFSYRTIAKLAVAKAHISARCATCCDWDASCALS